MQLNDLPTNVWLIDLEPKNIQALRPTRVLDIFDGGTENFHDDGLFSISTFGRIGSPERDEKFSYINTNVQLFHPFIYRTLCRLKALYKGILEGKQYAKWDPKERDFVASDVIEGDTGFQFFVNHWKEIKFKQTGSNQRAKYIELVEKWKERSMYDKVLVIPAGYRDVQIDETGRPKQDEINDFYRTIISISNTISVAGNKNSSVLDMSRLSLQRAFNNVYDYLENIVGANKTGFFQQKFGSRKVFNGTRNVITSMDTSLPALDSPNGFDYLSTGVGLFQTLKGALPFAQYHILNGWVKNVFGTGDGNALLVNPNTLKRESVKVDPKTIDKWTTASGIESVINSYGQTQNRLKPVMIEGYYIGLVYRGAKTFKFFGDIDELPDSFDRKNVHPITLVELLYIAGYKVWNTLGAYVTRYPVAGIGSIYPSWLYVKTTVVGEVRYELDEKWELVITDIAVEYPIIREGIAFLDSLMPHPSRVDGLVADFDGDTCSLNILYTEDGRAEIAQFFKTKKAYVSPGGTMIASSGYETVKRVLAAMTGVRNEELS